jgi:arylformamidase
MWKDIGRDKEKGPGAIQGLGGGDEEDRTPDLRIANATLSQLSYVPTAGAYSSPMTTPPDPAWLDTQYNNRARIPEHPAIFARWQQDSARVRAERRCVLDLRYGQRPEQTLDLFLPAAPAAHGAPVLVFIHGGYWRSLDKADQSFVAPAFCDAGALVVIPNYTLCPAVTIDTIALQMTRALAWVHRHVADHGGDARRTVVTGHSAGGHLAAMLLACDGTKVGTDLPARLTTRALALSGLFDLEPLRHTPFLAPDLRLSAASVRRLSPAGYAAPAGATLHALVGGAESDEFLRQNALVRERWGVTGVPVCEAVPGFDHLTILDDLAAPGGRGHERALSLLA